ncbi:accessory Sec system glycosylation chaperone GtfB [uncultured Lactobacillus sp.]|uniref:accessory Sec system glycosylation chaperone GtfB n=1 Tax=uncultured Lactobacillus sp. TaxID=153152 RepID=UPI00260C0DE3|nr:accessory Sec system glycosylation chaperone GtfB [uncultured Lactobacillus sp.]
MINLFENLDVESADFLRSQLFANMKIPSVVIHDNGFLPKEVDSPVKFYCKVTDKNSPLYFDRLTVPKFYRITATAQNAQVYDLHQKRADIVFTAADNTRLVKEVRWLDDQGNLNWIDHYNREGRLFAKTYVTNGQEVVRKYFDNENKEVITQYLLAGDVFLHLEDQELHFASLVEFVQFFLKERKYNLDHIFYNTLNQSMLVSLGIKENGTDTLFWHEKLNDDLPGNMKYLAANKTRTKHVVFQNYADWQNWKDRLPKSDNLDFRFLGMIYPHPRGNKLRPEVVILTNSDQIEHLTEIVESMPNITFHVAAITEMSDKLLSFNKYNNVQLYPNATPKRIRQLYQECDIYLDVNHGNEIMDAVRGAFEQNMLIMGFTNTIHNPNFIDPENVFELNEVDKMANKIRSALESTDKMRELVDKQRLSAGDTTIEKYHRAFEDITNE